MRIGIKTVSGRLPKQAKVLVIDTRSWELSISIPWVTLYRWFPLDDGSGDIVCKRYWPPRCWRRGGWNDGD